jgi:hypothetical protein
VDSIWGELYTTSEDDKVEVKGFRALGVTVAWHLLFSRLRTGPGFAVAKRCPPLTIEEQELRVPRIMANLILQQLYLWHLLHSFIEV